MSFPRYPAYKDSGVEWLGEVPEHWAVSPLKYVVRFRSGGTPSKDRHAYWEGSIPWASSKDMKSEALSETIDHITELAIEEGAAALLPAVTVVVVVRGMILARAFPVALTGAEISINQDLKALEATGNVSAAFLAWYLRGTSDESLRRLDEAAHGTKALRMEAWASLPVSFPDFEEQVQIAAFLDRETANIDALVAEQQNLIALLKEKRQALISHAVTKGLDPDVPMKDSGVAWLGAVPAHWTVAPIKYFVKFRSGGTPSKDRLDYWDGELPWASAKDLKTERLLDTADHISETAIDEGGANLLDAGTVLIVVRGMILARTFPVALTGSRMAINQDLKGLEPSPKMSAEFLAWYLRGTAAESLSRLDEAGHGTKALRMDAWASLEVSLPPLEEQLVIAEAVELETARIDELSVEADLAIALLQERRTALISAAVTGKIDVRHLAVAATTDPTPEPA